MKRQEQDKLRKTLLAKRQDLTARLGRISDNLRRGLDPDSAERAKQLEDRDVVDALGNEARDELRHIAATLDRMASGDFGTCTVCSSAIDDARLVAYPYADRCIDCARNLDREFASAL